MKNSILALLFLCTTYGVNAQQLPMYSQFYWNDFAINPAYTGLTGSARIQLGYRNQWSGFSGSPSTFTLGGHTLLKKQNIGLGGMLFLDDTGGALKQTGAMLNYSYILKLSKSSKLSIALSGVINQYSYDGSSIENIDPDPVLSGSVSHIAPDMSFGLVYALKAVSYTHLRAHET